MEEDHFMSAEEYQKSISLLVEMMEFNDASKVLDDFFTEHNIKFRQEFTSKKYFINSQEELDFAKLALPKSYSKYLSVEGQ